MVNPEGFGNNRLAGPLKPAPGGSILSGMEAIRPEAVAGLFYPGERTALQREVSGLLEQARTQETSGETPPRAVVAPHAGYPFSGALAARAYAHIAPFSERYQRVLLLGPSHRVPLRGLAVSTAGAFRTPLGDIALDRRECEALGALADVDQRDDAHAHEHSLEVHLPFLQTLLGEFRLIPVVVGDASPRQVAPVVERYWDDPATLIVISTDLSHFLDYDRARAVDRRTCDAVEALDYNALAHEQACGRNPLRGLLAVAKDRGANATTLGLYNSGDVTGERSRVVGYGAWLVQ